VVLVGAPDRLVAVEQVFLDIALAGGGGEGGDPVFVRDDPVECGAGGNVAGRGYTEKEVMRSNVMNTLIQRINS
jgi:hypothetical protein